MQPVPPARRGAFRRTRAVAVLAATTTATLGLVAVAPLANAATTDVVNPASADWSSADTRPGGAFEFTNAYPDLPGFGNGALELSTNESQSAKVQYFTSGAGRPLSSIDGVSYSSFRAEESAGNPIQIPTVNLYLDPDGSGPLEFAPLVFEPYYSYGTPTEGVWQTWDGTGAAQWWSNRAIGSIPAFSYVPLANYQAAAPDAVITAMGFNLGSGNPSIKAAVDGLTVDAVNEANTVTYDFETLSGIVVDDDGAATLGNCDADADAFGTIQSAVTYAPAGSTVNVCPGLYDEDITVGKQLTFLGAKAGVDPRGSRPDTTGESVIDGYLNANGVSGTTIDGFWFTHSTSNISIGLYNGTSGHTVRNNVIAGNNLPAIEAAIIYTADGTSPVLFERNRVTGGDQHGFFATPEASNVTIRDNEFAGNGSSVVHFAPAPGVSSNVVVTGNTSTGDGNFIVGSGVNNLTVANNTVSGTTGTGMLFGGDFSNVTITNNTVTGSNGTGISMTNNFGAANTNFTITENTITGNQRGVSFGTNGYTGMAEVHFNRIVDNSSETDGRVGIRNLSSGVIDAEDNWFGCNEGTGGTDCDKDLGTVDSSPHLVLDLTVAPDPITGTSDVTADLTSNSAGIDRSGAGTIPATPVTFATDKGTLSGTSATLVEGVATVQISRDGAKGTGTVSATVDHETVQDLVSFKEPKLSVSDVTITEAAGQASFTVSLDGPSDEAVTFEYKTIDGSASAESGDYTETTGAGIIAAGDSTFTINVPVNDDASDEGTEDFTLRLTDASVALADRNGVATITDNDNEPTVSVSDAEGLVPGMDILEGTQGTFTLTLSAPSGTVTKVNVTTKNGTAKSPQDFTAVTETITFQPGETTKTVVVSTRLDQKIEGNERFTLKLSKAKKMSIADGVGKALIMSNIT